MISLLTAGALGIALMVNFPAENSAALLSPSAEFAQALIEITLPVDLDTANPSATTATAEAMKSAPIPPLLTSAPISPLALIAALATLPFICALLIILSRWRIPPSPPIDDDPARYLRRSLL